MVGGNRITEAPEVVFDLTQGDEGVETPPPNDSLKASHSPPVGGRLRSFRKDWQTNKCSNNVLNIITNGYSLPFITIPKLAPDSVRIQGPSKRSSSGLLYPVSSVKECNRKGGKCKISRVLTARCLMPLIGLLASMEKMVPEGHLHMRPFQFHLKEHWRYPQLLDNLLPWSETILTHLEWWQNPTNVMKGTELYPIDHSIQIFKRLKRRLGRSLRASLYKGSDREIRLHINVLELKAVSLASVKTKKCPKKTPVDH